MTDQVIAGLAEHPANLATRAMVVVDMPAVLEPGMGRTAERADAILSHQDRVDLGLCQPVLLAEMPSAMQCPDPLRVPGCPCLVGGAFLGDDLGILAAPSFLGRMTRPAVGIPAILPLAIDGERL